MTERLYGLEGDEWLESDFDTAVEWAIDDAAEHVDEVTVYEWDVYPQDHPVPSADVIVDWLVETISEESSVDRPFAEDFYRRQHADVLVAANKLRQAVVAHVDFRIARQVVAEHHVVRVENGPDREAWVVETTGARYEFPTYDQKEQR